MVTDLAEIEAELKTLRERITAIYADIDVNTGVPVDSIISTTREKMVRLERILRNMEITLVKGAK